MRMLFSIAIALVMFLPVHSQGPDVIVGQLNGVANYASTTTPDGTFEVFSVGTTSCNIGDDLLQWQSDTSLHPVIGQNLYKIQGGVLEQIGQSWLKHGFCALSQTLCGPCASTPCPTLGIGCSDPYTASRNGTQSTLGPRTQVNPSTGEFPYPFVAPDPPTNVGRRLQVPVELLIASADGAQYFVDGQYITADDTAAGNHMNNISICQVTMLGSGVTWSATMNPLQTLTERNVIEHWAAIDPGVQLETLATDGGDGRVWVACKVIETDGVYRYEYAIYNENSHDAVGSFEVALPDSLPLTLDDGFHAVHHHSGSGEAVIPGVDPEYAPYGDAGYTNGPWSVVLVPGTGLRWETGPTSVPANPIRWGTMYNCRFVTNAPPVSGEATLTTWRTGESHTVSVLRPTDDYVPAVTDVHCEYDLIADAATITWENAAGYEEVQVYRETQLIATLTGDATSHVDALATPGSHDYEVIAWIAGQESAPVSCEVTVPSQALNFAFRFLSVDLPFEPVSGVGSAQTAITVAEDPDNPGFPHDVAAFAIAFTYDSALLSIGAVTPAPALDVLDPEFLEVLVIEDASGPTGGVTIGVVIDLFVAPPFLVASEEIAILDVMLATIPSSAETALTEVFFEDGVHGAIPISNVVTVNLQSIPVLSVPGQISLVESASSLFRRGDVNLDGVLDVADPVFDLMYQTSGGPVHCLAAHDTNDDGVVDLEDPIHSLNFQFIGGPPVSAPNPGCGFDPTIDGLGCDEANCP